MAKPEKERIGELCAIYAQMIEPIKGESYKETATRLSNAIGTRIESEVFHKTVKFIRMNAFVDTIEKVRKDYHNKKK